MTRGAEPEILIVGAGAVGLGVGSALLAAGRRVRFVARPDTAAALQRNGLARTGLFGALRVPPGAFAAHASLDAVPRRPAAHVLVTVKSYDSAPVARALAAAPALFGPATRVVLFQNGWGNAETFAAELSPECVFCARVITGFRRPTPSTVDVTVHADAVHIGSSFGADAAPLEPLARGIAAGGLPCRLTDDIAADLWAKLLYNCALNPLGALLAVPYGALGERAETRRLLAAIVAEVFAAMRAAGYTTHWQTPEAYLADLYGVLLPPTAGHESSMLQDLRAGKRTEIDALSGAVVRLAEAGGAAAPVNAALVALISHLERRGRRAAGGPATGRRGPRAAGGAG